MALIGTNPVSKRKKRPALTGPSDPDNELIQENQEANKLFKSADGEPAPAKLFQCTYPGCTKTFKQL